MKILQVINSLATGGAEKLILDTIPRYNRMGIKVDLLLLNGSFHPFLDELKQQACCEIFTLGTSSPYQLKFIGQLIPFFKKYDLIHAHLFPSSYFLVIAKRVLRSKTPLIFTEHSTSNRRFTNKNLRWINKNIYRSFDKIICITEEVKTVVEQHTQVPDDKLIIINNGVDTQKYGKAAPLPRKTLHSTLTDDDFLLIQVSSFREAKDQKTVIRSLKSLPERTKLFLVGDGVLRNENESLVKELGLEDRVFFLGNRSDIPNILKTCDVVILSSHYEGFGLASIEGMASAKPVVVSNVPGLADIVRGAGLLFEKGNAGELSGLLLKLMNDEKFYDETVENCRKRTEHYSIDIMVEKHIELYRSFEK